MKKTIATIAAFAVAALCVFAGVGRTDLLTVDLNRKATPYKWSWTEVTDNAVRVTVMRDGEEFPTAGWTGALFIGNGERGKTFTGTPSGYCTLVFDIPHGTLPTNGVYQSQLISSTADGRTEEWARGTVTVALNQAASALPDSWSLYTEIASKVNNQTLAAMLAVDGNVTALTNKLTEVGYSAGGGSVDMTEVDEHIKAATNAITTASIGAVAKTVDNLNHTETVTIGNSSLDGYISIINGGVRLGEGNEFIGNEINVGSLADGIINVGHYSGKITVGDSEGKVVINGGYSQDQAGITISGQDVATKSYVGTALAGVYTKSEVIQKLNGVKDLHADMAQSVVWKNVYSNGWVYLVAFTNDLSVVNAQ